MAVTGISNEEFQRMQTQLLDLREANYALMEEGNRSKNELRGVNAKYESLLKEYHKALKTLEKSRKARDVEMLFSENEALQRKLVTQEEEFRLQNETLLQELKMLTVTNDKLEKYANERQNGSPEIKSQDGQCQCDLLTESYEKLVSEEKSHRQKLEKDLALTIEQSTNTDLKWQQIKQTLDAQISSLTEQLSSSQQEAARLPDLLDRLDQAEQEKTQSKDQLTSLEKQLEQVRAESNKRSLQLEDDHRMAMASLLSSIEDREKNCQVQLEVMSAQRAEFEEEAVRCRQEAQDALEDARIAERRIASVTQDLRRQLRCERRRADKLQDRLRDFISSNGSSSQVSPAETVIDADNCSVSSWSLMSGQNESNGAVVVSSSSNGTPSPPFPPTDSPSSERNNHRTSAVLEAEPMPDLATENCRLVSRLANLQQEKWRLEERLSQLEEANSAMTDELVKRGQLIQHYCMEGKQPSTKIDANSGSPQLFLNKKLSVRQMMSMIRQQIGNDSTEDSSAEVQRRLQRMLEETLTKNMHLQEDMERLSQEVVRLSQLAATASINSTVSVTGNGLC